MPLLVQLKPQHLPMRYRRSKWIFEYAASLPACLAVDRAAARRRPGRPPWSAPALPATPVGRCGARPLLRHAAHALVDAGRDAVARRAGWSSTGCAPPTMKALPRARRSPRGSTPRWPRRRLRRWRVDRLLSAGWSGWSATLHGPIAGAQYFHVATRPTRRASRPHPVPREQGARPRRRTSPRRCASRASTRICAPRCSPTPRPMAGGSIRACRQSAARARCCRRPAAICSSIRASARADAGRQWRGHRPDARRRRHRPDPDRADGRASIYFAIAQPLLERRRGPREEDRRAARRRAGPRLPQEVQLRSGRQIWRGRDRHPGVEHRLESGPRRHRAGQDAAEAGQAQFDGQDEGAVRQQLRHLPPRHRQQAAIRRGQARQQQWLHPARGCAEAGALAVRRPSPRRRARCPTKACACPSRCRSTSPI